MTVRFTRTRRMPNGTYTQRRTRKYRSPEYKWERDWVGPGEEFPPYPEGNGLGPFLPMSDEEKAEEIENARTPQRVGEQEATADTEDAV